MITIRSAGETLMAASDRSAFSLDFNREILDTRRDLIDDSLPLVRSDGHLLTLAEIEAAAIDHALLVCGSRAAAAQALGIGRSTIYRKVEQIFGREGCAPLLFGETEQLPACAADGLHSAFDGRPIESR